MYVVVFHPRTCEIRFSRRLRRFNGTPEALNLLSCPFEVLNQVRK
jgi:hypothetical protein